MVCELYFNEAVKTLTCLKSHFRILFNTESDSVKSETGPEILHFWYSYHFMPVVLVWGPHFEYQILYHQISCDLPPSWVDFWVTRVWFPANLTILMFLEHTLPASTSDFCICPSLCLECSSHSHTPYVHCLLNHYFFQISVQPLSPRVKQSFPDHPTYVAVLFHTLSLFFCFIFPHSAKYMRYLNMLSIYVLLDI